MAESKSKKAEGLTYKGHPLRRVDNLIYYGTMAEKYIIMMQILDTQKVKDLDVATRVSVQLQLTDPDRIRALYLLCRNGYEKLQVFRLLQN